MSFDASAGRILITDGASGTVVFDTNQELLHLLSAPISGAITRPQQTVGGPSRGRAVGVRDADFFVANLPSTATHIVGLVRFEFAGGNIAASLPSGSWFPSGGTHVLFQKTYQSSDGAYQSALSSMVTATFYQSGSTIRFKEQVRLYDGLQEIGGILFGYTATYRLFPAAFS